MVIRSDSLAIITSGYQLYNYQSHYHDQYYCSFDTTFIVVISIIIPYIHCTCSDYNSYRHCHYCDYPVLVYPPPIACCGNAWVQTSVLP